ncbi:MAG: permease of phosphate ABC transporter [Oscillibacter sp.]|nr:permease of phosphate ABC transporter [Oscillibacter sp.]
MKRLLEIGKRYLAESDWKDLALIKFCLCSMGILIGTQVRPKMKNVVIAAAGSVFLMTYATLMAKLFRMVFHKK